MATAVVVPQRSLTRGWAQVPNSLIENQKLLTRGEMALALLVLRRGSNVHVSDRTWSAWTGLSPRMKEYAVAGLRNKGLRVEGEGDKARFTFEPEGWTGYVKTAPDQEEKPRTAGRQVDPKPGAKVHPECRDRGCAMLRAECSSGLSLVSSTSVAQPVAQENVNPQPVSQENVNPQPVSPVSSNPGLSGLSIVSSTSVAQPVAQEWQKTLAAVRGFFPLVAWAFIRILIGAVAAVFSGVTDDELSQAVVITGNAKRGRQHSEGLFLVTVPEALAELRKLPGQRPAPNEQARYREHLDALRASLKVCSIRGPAERALQRLAVAGMKFGGSIDGLVACEEELNAAATEFAAAVFLLLPAESCTAIQGEVAKTIQVHRHRMTPQQIESLRAQQTEAAVFRAVGLQRFSLFYADSRL